MHEIIDCIIAYLTSNEQTFPLTKIYHTLYNPIDGRTECG